MLDRRNWEAVLKFCSTANVDNTTTTTVNAYYEHLTHELHNLNEEQAFQLLPESLRVELVLEKSWFDLCGKLTLLDRTAFDEVSNDVGCADVDGVMLSFVLIDGVVVNLLGLVDLL